MPYLTDLADALRNAGIGVWESPGWRGRGHGPMSGVRGILIHHTAGGGSNDWRVVQNGRPGLSGPLAQMTFERNGGVRLLAAGQCWHSGNGTHPAVGGSVGNRRLIGIEGVSRGVGDDWTEAQRREYPRVAAALCRHYRLPASAVIGHKEYATPRGRKIDPHPWDMNHFRREVARHLRGGAPRPAPAPAPRRARLTEDHTMLITTGDDETRWVSYFFEPGTLSVVTLGWGTAGQLHNAKWWLRKGKWNEPRGVHEINVQDWGHGGAQPHHMALRWPVPADADCLEIAVTAPGQGLHIVGTPR